MPSTNAKGAHAPTEKLARICWNTNGWKKPSGRNGKSGDKNTFECEQGFGFEEWLFDDSAEHEGYRYGFLQQFNSRSKRNEGPFTIHLYANSPKNWLGKTNTQDIYIGCIENVEVVDEVGLIKVFHHFLSVGRLTRMYKEVYGVGGEWPRMGILFTTPEDVFNIRFKPENIHVLPHPRLIEPNSIKSHWYKLQDPPSNLGNGIEVDMKW